MRWLWQQMTKDNDFLGNAKLKLTLLARILHQYPGSWRRTGALEPPAVRGQAPGWNVAIQICCVPEGHDDPAPSASAALPYTTIRAPNAPELADDAVSPRQSPEQIAMVGQPLTGVLHRLSDFARCRAAQMDTDTDGTFNRQPVEDILLYLAAKNP